MSREPYTCKARVMAFRTGEMVYLIYAHLRFELNVVALGVAPKSKVAPQPIVVEKPIGDGRRSIEAAGYISWARVDTAVFESSLIGQRGTPCPAVAVVGIRAAESVYLAVEIAANGIGQQIRVEQFGIRGFAPWHITAFAIAVCRGSAQGRTSVVCICRCASLPAIIAFPAIV